VNEDVLNNDLFRQMVADFKPCIRPEKWEGFVKRLIKRNEEWGGIVKREKKIYPLDDAVYDYLYTFKDGSQVLLDSVRMGLIQKSAAYTESSVAI